MKKRLVLVVALILIATMVFVTGCGKKEEPKPEPQAEAQEEGYDFFHRILHPFLYRILTRIFISAPMIYSTLQQTFASTGFPKNGRNMFVHIIRCFQKGKDVV